MNTPNCDKRNKGAESSGLRNTQTSHMHIAAHGGENHYYTNKDQWSNNARF